MKNKENQHLFDMSDMTQYKNVGGKLETAEKADKEEIVPTTFRLRGKSAQRFDLLYKQQDKNKGEFASDVIDSFFKWFAIDNCITKEDLEAKDEQIKELQKKSKELDKKVKDLEEQLKSK